MSTISEAAKYARECHRGQLRKGTDKTYFEAHLVPVANRILKAKGTPEQVQAGLLHDTIEECQVTQVMLEALFGKLVAEIVQCCTKEKTQEGAYAKIRFAMPEAQLVILADKLSNLSDVAEDYNNIGAEVWLRFKAGERVMEKFEEYGKIFIEWGNLPAKENSLRQSYLYTLNKLLTTLGYGGFKYKAPKSTPRI